MNEEHTLSDSCSEDPTLLHKKTYEEYDVESSNVTQGRISTEITDESNTIILSKRFYQVSTLVLFVVVTTLLAILAVVATDDSNGRSITSASASNATSPPTTGTPVPSPPVNSNFTITVPTQSPSSISKNPTTTPSAGPSMVVFPSEWPSHTASQVPTPSSSVPSHQPSNAPTTGYPTIVPPPVTPRPTIGALIQVGTDILGEAVEDRFGKAVSMSLDGTVIAAGGYLNDAAGTTAGHVRVFRFNQGGWLQQGNAILGEAAYDNSGRSMALSGDGSVVAIGAPGNDGGGINSGHVRLFGWDGSTWTQRGPDIDGTTSSDSFGSSVALSKDGSVVASGGRNSGVRVYVWTHNQLVQLGTTLDQQGRTAGVAVSLSSDGLTLATATTFSYTNTDGSAAGIVRVHRWTGTWTKVGFDLENDNYGESVSLSGTGSTLAVASSLAVNAAGVASGRCRVYLESLDSGWIQLGQDLEGQDRGDLFGESLAISANAQYLVVGARQSGNYGHGYVRMFRFSRGNWLPLGQTLSGDSQFADSFGDSVAISETGSRIAVGGPWFGDNGSRAGLVRAYEVV